MNASVVINRRGVLAGGGALILSFSLGDAFAQDQTAPAAAPPPPSPPGSLKGAPYLDSWIRIDADGSITVFTGKAELGQGFRTACAANRRRGARCSLCLAEAGHGRYQPHRQ